MDIGSRVAGWMQHRGLNQKQLADKSGISRAMMSQVVGRGKYKTNPSQKTLKAIVENGLELSMEQFYGPIPSKSSSAA